MIKTMLIQQSTTSCYVADMMLVATVVYTSWPIYLHLSYDPQN